MPHETTVFKRSEFSCGIAVVVFISLFIVKKDRMFSTINNI
ncbi:hypothetical protein [Paraliobacillus sp. JSM ZJ581]